MQFAVDVGVFEIFSVGCDVVAEEPGAHYVVEGFKGDVCLSQCDGFGYERGVWNGDAAEDASWKW